MTAPDESQMAHCRDCAHRLGSGCGCPCCAWAGEAAEAGVNDVADFLGSYGLPLSEIRAATRIAVQAALPVVQAAAAAAERERCAAWLESIAPDYALGTTALAHAAQRLRAPGA